MKIVCHIPVVQKEVTLNTKPLNLVPFPCRILRKPGAFDLSAPVSLIAPSELEGTQVLLQLLPLFPNIQPEAPSSLRIDTGINGLGDDAYRLLIREEGVEIAAGGDAGAYYAVQTLRQLQRLYPDQLPCVEIDDSPDFSARGIMLDISRSKVPKMETLYQLVDLFSSLKLNQLQLYTEHTFAYRNHETVWKDASPMTADEIRALDQYCTDRFVQLVPNQNSFGHLRPWLKHDPYRHLAEAPDGCDTEWGPQEEPFSLAPLERGSVQLLDELYAELLPNFSSGTFNVGCDETVDLGKGRSRDACEKLGKGRVYLDFLLKIHGLVEKNGKTMMFWADIINRYPELIKELPQDVIALEWGYEADHPFDEHSARFKENSIPFYVCPGTSSWNAISGRTDNAMANLTSAAASGKNHGAQGFLITDWGDRGHWQPLPVSYPGFTCGAALSWNSSSDPAPNLADAIDTHVLEQSVPGLASVLLSLGRTDTCFKKNPFNASTLFCLLFYYDQKMSEGEGRLSGVTFQGIQSAQTMVTNLRQSLLKLDSTAAEGVRLLRELKNVCRMLLHACEMSIHRWNVDGQRIECLSLEIRDKLRKDLEDILEEYRDLWFGRNRSGGLGESTAHLENLCRIYSDEKPETLGEDPVNPPPEFSP